MSNENILVVDDEEDILELVRYNLAKEGYKVQCVASGEEGVALAKKANPDLIVLDLMLTGIDGFEVCRRVRRERATQDIPIIILSAKGEESDIVLGLGLGADDYLVKPFSPKVLNARVQSVLRRRRLPAIKLDAIVTIQELTIDPGRHEVKVKGESVDLTATEFKILHFLARQAGWVFTRYQIVDAVHGENYPVTERSIDVQIVSLRKKLGSYGDYIETIRGVGYRFQG